ncbi:MAG: S8 family serine peptidase [Candidatus Eremiobacteraeota bacterium]|nr:S8 family serine peptidase [Candidatus Eremiobacteraeota bacterium]
MQLLQRSLAFVVLASLVSACGGSGSSGPPPIAATATPVGVLPTTVPSSPSPGSTATPTTNAAAFTCPSSDTASAVAVSSARGGEAVRRRATAGRRGIAATPGRLAVSYDRATLRASSAALASRETSLGARLIREFDYGHLDVSTRLLSVPPQRIAAVAASLRMQPGVRGVSIVGGRRAKQTVTTPDFTNDPYFAGFSTTLATSATATPPPATFEVGPYEESASVPGQWNMHAIGLENAFAYGVAGNGSGITNANALGSAGVKVAIIDVGEDTTHPELSGKIAYQKCFITDPTTSVQSSSSFTTDEDGHGTDVSGIAAAATNNGFGFTAAGGRTSLYAYRVQATPDDNCNDSTTTDEQCSIDTVDISSAIEDAIAQNVQVISISLGGGTCTSSGADPDSIEGGAIADAIAAGVVVVAASGNDGSEGVEAPACDPGVIAAGATSLEDGQLNGTGAAGGSASSPSEYVASYSDYGSPGATVRNANAWGIVAPGGDPSSDTDADDLHWIEDIWTSTPFDTTFAGSCTPDYPNTTGAADCRTLIAGRRCPRRPSRAPRHSSSPRTRRMRPRRR